MNYREIHPKRQGPTKHVQYHKLGPFLTAPTHRNQKKQALTYVKAMVLIYLYVFFWTQTVELSIPRIHYVMEV